MKIILPGGTGQIGQILARHFRAQNHEVIILGRGPGATVRWDARTLGDWTQHLDGADVVVNLAGRSVNCRYNAANRAAILNSRVDSTRILGQAIQNSKNPPKLWLQSSTATIYSHRYDAPNDELTGQLGGSEPGAQAAAWRFSIDVAQSWERACLEFQTRRTRKVLLRSAMVMSPDSGGVFDTLYTLVRRRLGAKNGNGRQFVSWIHDADFTRAIDHLITHQDLDGPVNLASSNPIPNADFMRALRQAAGVRLALPSPSWLLEIGAIFLRTETELILKSRRVIPTRLLQSGFTFTFPDWPPAAQDLCQRRKLDPH